MLVLNDSDKLGDKTLSLTEGVEKAREETARKAAAYKVPDQSLLENADMARGWSMNWTELIRRIAGLNRNILFEKGGVPNAVAVRIVDGEEKRYVTGFYQEVLPEFSSVVTDGNGLPVREVRGWRSVLLALVRAKALTERQVVTTFGPALGQRAVLWDRSFHARR